MTFGKTNSFASAHTITSSRLSFYHDTRGPDMGLRCSDFWAARLQDFRFTTGVPEATTSLTSQKASLCIPCYHIGCPLAPIHFCMYLCCGPFILSLGGHHMEAFRDMIGMHEQRRTFGGFLAPH